MEQNEKAQSATQVVEEPQIILSIDENHLLVPAIAFVFEKVRKHNQGKFSNLARFSREEFAKYLLEQGIRAVENAVEADMERRNKDAYVNAMAKLQQPNVDEKNPEKYANALTTYLRQVDALKRKYGIGGTQQEV